MLERSAVRKHLHASLIHKPLSLQQTLSSGQGWLEVNRHPAHLSLFPGAEDLGLSWAWGCTNYKVYVKKF